MTMLIVMSEDVVSTYSVAKAKANLSELLAGVEEGRTQIITKRGKPIAHVVPAKEPRPYAPFNVDRLRAFVSSLPDPIDNADEALARWKAHERF